MNLWSILLTFTMDILFQIPYSSGLAYTFPFGCHFSPFLKVGQVLMLHATLGKRVMYNAKGKLDERQKVLTTSHLYTQLDPFASKLMKCEKCEM